MLSRMLNLGLNPHFLRYSSFSLNPFIIVSSFVFAIGSARIEFELQSYMMNIVPIPSSDFTGNLPVQSMYVVPSFGLMVIVAQNNSFIFDSSCLGGISSAASSEFNH